MCSNPNNSTIILNQLIASQVIDVMAPLYDNLTNVINQIIFEQNPTLTPSTALFLNDILSNSANIINTNIIAPGYGVTNISNPNLNQINFQIYTTYKSNMFDKCYFTTVTLQTIINYFILDTTNFFQVITNNGTYPPNILSIIEPITYSVSDYSLDVTNKLLFFRNCVLECIKLYQIYLKCEKEINDCSIRSKLENCRCKKCYQVDKCNKDNNSGA